MTKNPFRSEKPDHNEILRFLSPLSKDYPDFFHWYASKVTAGLLTGERVLRTVRNDGRIIALSILKITEAERKICCIRVSSSARGKALGRRGLMDATRILGTDSPLMTVSEDKEAMFRPLLNSMKFVKTREVPNAYIMGRRELIYNGGNLDGNDIPENRGGEASGSEVHQGTLCTAS